MGDKADLPLHQDSQEILARECRLREQPHIPETQLLAQSSRGGNLAVKFYCPSKTHQSAMVIQIRFPLPWELMVSVQMVKPQYPADQGWPNLLKVRRHV